MTATQCSIVPKRVMSVHVKVTEVDLFVSSAGSTRAVHFPVFLSLHIGEHCVLIRSLDFLRFSLLQYYLIFCKILLAVGGDSRFTRKRRGFTTTTHVSFRFFRWTFKMHSYFTFFRCHSIHHREA